MENSCFFIVVVTLLLLLKCTTPCSGRNFFNFSTDQDALLAFKATISPDSYGILANNWSTKSTSICYWIGVSCGIKHRRVTALNLSDFNLKGTVTPHLGNLTFLRSLDISFNNFTGIIPDELSNLRHLKEINVVFNFFTGEVPSWLGTLPELQYIHLNNNNFTGKIPRSLFNTTSKLQTLNLQYNPFAAGSMPYGIFKMSSIRDINLMGCSLSGTLPSDVCDNTPKLKTLSLSFNQLYGKIPPNIYKCRGLEDLRLSYNLFDDNIPSKIGSLVNLKILYLGNNRFGGDVPTQLGNLTSLSSLWLGANKLTSSIPKQLGNLTSLKSLSLDVNILTGELPQELSNLAYLEEFYISDNALSGSIPPFMFNISTLKIMSLQSNHFSGSLPSTIGMGLSLLNLEELDLGDNRLMGPIPPNIGNLISLQFLSLYSNQLTGEVKKKFFLLGNHKLLEFNQFTAGSMTYGIFKVSSLRAINLRGCNLPGKLPSDMCNNIPKLKTLDLSRNQLYGEIPPNIYECGDLEDLRLSFNHFNGNIPSEIGSLVNLKMLALDDNSFGGGIPKQLGNLTSLNSIYLGINNLKGEIPQELSHLAYLETFKVGTNALSGSIPSFMFNISTLKIMSLQSNYFSGSLPSTIGMGFSLSNLEELYLSDNRLIGPIPNYITNASKLTNLGMYMNSFSGPIPSFGNLRLLQILRIWKNNLTGDLSFLSLLTNCRYLQVLQISINPLNVVLPTSIGNLSTSLKEFHAAKCDITGAIPPEIGNLITLQILALYSNRLTGFIPTSLGKLKQLQGIYLNDNRLQGYIPPDLCQMRNLVELSLYGNMLTSAIPECLGELTTLSLVDLGSNNLNSTIPSNFWNLVDLLYIDLSSNNLSGQFSSDIGSLKVIISLDLSLNQFSGDIPSSIGSSQTIEFLSLAHNKFENSIPKSLGNIINLESLDLSNNNLSGAIPKSLEGLRYLRYFNVSYNKLEGEIPTGGPFVNFTAQSFVQNYALCGAIQFHVPLCVQNRTISRANNVSSLLVKYILPPIISTIILVIIIIVFIRRRKQNKVPPPTDISLGIAWRRISYQELVRGTSSFSETNLLGKGGFGSVFKGILSDDGLNVAIKVFNMQLEGASKSFDAECEILSSVRHRNLVRIIGCCCNTDFKALVLAYMPNGSLEKWLYSESYCLDLLRRLNIALDVALALEYLHHGHTFPVVHCDIKPSNVLLDEDMTAYVADFGLSKLFDEGEVLIQTNTLATIGYIAPEYGSEGKVSTNGDVYSYGILLLEIFTIKKPTDDMFSEEMSLKDWVSRALLRQQNAVNEIVAPGLLTREDRHFSAKEECVSSVFRLAMECLAFSPEERINTMQIVAALQKIKTRFLASNRLH